jgi:hypothetical protein
LTFGKAPVQCLVVLHAVLLLITSLAALGCTRSVGAEAAAPSPGRTIRITASQFGSTVSVRVGDVLKIERPANHERWTVDFSRDVLRSLNTDEGRRTPPPDGWTFAVVHAGTTDLVFTAVASQSGTPNVPRFVLTITAE